MRSDVQEVSGYRFERSHLRVGERRDGVSAFMRIRNGEEWLETSIRSHEPYFDEIVAVYNQCTDGTPEILRGLQKEFGPDRIRVFHYVDAVHPPGSSGHAVTPADDPRSLVNYYNFSLVQTRYRYATKLDDDHLAIREPLAELTARLKSGDVPAGVMHCFSGLNLFRRPDGTPGILGSDPISGGGDIGFFEVTPETLFIRDRRFERFQRGGQRRRFAGYLYWHLKFMKRDLGFGNYELAQNQGSRYAKRLDALLNDTDPARTLAEIRSQLDTGVSGRIKMLLPGKAGLIGVRDSRVKNEFPDESLEAAILRTTDPRYARPLFRAA